ncbi:MAG: hypothetical protein R3194_03315 [Limnobacter sp.]|nr:hypothetical protein [Limnobacter sp.]
MKSIMFPLSVGLPLLLTACVVAVPLPGDEAAPAQPSERSSAQTNTACDPNNPVVTDMSFGTHKVTLEDSCQLAKITIVNQNKQYAKQCEVVFGNKATELYVPVGQTRVVSQAKPIEPNNVTYSCKNDWNSPR